MRRYLTILGVVCILFACSIPAFAEDGTSTLTSLFGGDAYRQADAMWCVLSLGEHMPVPEGIDTGVSGPLFDRAVAEGMLYIPGAFCFPREGTAPRTNLLRLSFGVPHCDAIRHGVEALSRAIRQVC